MPLLVRPVGTPAVDADADEGSPTPRAAKTAKRVRLVVPDDSSPDRHHPPGEDQDDGDDDGDGSVFDFAARRR
jgi:hypothetical protein